jgi:hypothetical protein
MHDKKDDIANLKAATILVTADLEDEERTRVLRVLNIMVRTFVQGHYELPTAHKGLDFHKIMVPSTKMVGEALHYEFEYSITEADIEEFMIYMMDTYFNPLVMNPIRRWNTSPELEETMAYTYINLFIQQKAQNIYND